MSKRVWTEDRLNYLREIAKGRYTDEITDMINSKFGTDFKLSQIRAAMSNHKIKSGVNANFKKGSVPWNKGKKGWYAPGVENTWFKKGRQSENKRPIGSRQWLSGYLLEKVSDTGHRNTDWRPVHQLLWQEHHGKIPDGHIIIFLDKDTSNIDIDNLACVKRETSAQMNRQGLHDTYADITRVGISLTELKRKLKESDSYVIN